MTPSQTALLQVVVDNVATLDFFDSDGAWCLPTPARCDRLGIKPPRRGLGCIEFSEAGEITDAYPVPALTELDIGTYLIFWRGASEFMRLAVRFNGAHATADLAAMRAELAANPQCRKADSWTPARYREATRRLASREAARRSRERNRWEYAQAGR